MRLSTTDKLAVYLNYYTIEPRSYKPLAGYISENYKVTDSSDRNWLLKVYQDSSEIPNAISENMVLNYLHQHGVVNISKPITNKHGQYLTAVDNDTYCRLLSYIEGSIMTQQHMTTELLQDFGAKAAKLDLVMGNVYQDQVAARRDKWNLLYLTLSKRDIDCIREANERKIVAYFLDQYEALAGDKVHLLRHSMIHNDLNDQNVIIGDNVINGFIDFGDMAYAPLIFEVAIALTYIMMLSSNPIVDACTFITAYHNELPLQKQEVKLLYYLIAGRLCTSVISSAKAKDEGADTEYIMISEKPAWKMMRYWMSISPKKITNAFLRATCFQTDDPVTLTARRENRRQTLIPSAIKMSYKNPIHMHSAAFQYMHDVYGNTYLDAYNNVSHIGHCHPAVTAAISQQSRILNTNSRYHYDSLGEYAEQLLSYFPSSLSRVFFLNSGSAASDLSIRLAQNFTGKKKMACIESGYHGNTQMGINVSPYKYNGRGGSGIAPQILELPLAKLYHGEMSSADDYLADAKQRIAHSIDHGQALAGFIAEAISGCGGQVPLAPGYLRGMHQYLSKLQIPLIIDEVQTGFGRIGSHFWAYEMHEVIPEMVVLGKPMGNGHPLAAVVCTQDIAESFDNGMEFFSSFGGNPVSCEVGKAVLNVIEEEGLRQNAMEIGGYMKEQLSSLAKFHLSIGDVRGHGLFLGVELMTESGKPDTKLAQHIKHYLKDRYILTSTDGKYDNVLKIKPPLCFTAANADQYCEVLKDGLADAAHYNL